MQSVAEDASARVTREPRSSIVKRVIVGLALVVTLLAVLFFFAPGVVQAVGRVLFGDLGKEPFVLLFLTMAGGYAIAKILATGGTIAGAGTSGGYGYTAGAFKVEDLRPASQSGAGRAGHERRRHHARHRHTGGDVVLP
jgi:hypothetical protein